MSRVLVPTGASWFSELKAVSYYGESDLERTIRQHLNALFPDHHVFPFKKDIASRTTSVKKRPDLAMVSRDLSAWGIIEVELAEHDIKHVLDQTRVFLDGDYNAVEMAQYIRNQLKDHCKKSASLTRLKDLLSNQLPTVLVIADSHAEGWLEELKKSGVELCVFEIYKNARGAHIYRTFGNYPVMPVQEAHCRRHPSISNVIEVIGNFTFKVFGKSKEIQILFDEYVTRWSLMEDDGKAYLRFLGQVNPISPNATYGLFADKANRYYFKRS